MFLEFTFCIRMRAETYRHSETKSTKYIFNKYNHRSYSRYEPTTAWLSTGNAICFATFVKHETDKSNWSSESKKSFNRRTSRVARLFWVIFA